MVFWYPHYNHLAGFKIIFSNLDDVVNIVLIHIINPQIFPSLLFVLRQAGLHKSTMRISEKAVDG